MNIRHVTIEDAEALLELQQTIDAEADYLLYEAGERTTTLVEQTERIAKVVSTPNSTILVAENEDGQLVGYLTANGGAFSRNRHDVNIGVGILQAFIGRKIGTYLFLELERWAREIGIRRLTLGVMKANEHAYALYRKMGFELEGCKKEAFYVKGSYIDEYLLAKML